MIIPEAKRLEPVKEYYFSKKLRQIAQMKEQGIPVINLGIGSPDLKPSQQTIDQLSHIANLDDTHGYQSYRGIPQLRNAMSKWYKKNYNVEVNPENEILPLIGSKEGIMHISMSFLNPGDEVLVPDPGYPTYTSVSKLVGAKIKYYNLDENNRWKINFEQLDKHDFSNIKIMWTNYPHMPTGTNADLTVYQQLVKLAKKHDFLICNDNPYSLILNDTPLSIFNVPEAKQVALELNSLSKSHNMAGWRIGYLLGAPDYIKTVLKFKSNMDSGMFLALQLAAAKALENPLNWHKQQNEQYSRRRKYAWQILDVLNCSYDKKQSGMFIWAKVPDNVQDVEFFVENILQKAHVFITPGFIFGSNGKRYVRISLCSTVGVLKTSLQRIKDIISNEKS